MSDLADLTLSERIGWAADMMHPENEIWMPILAAARQRLRLSRQPCQTCGGKGRVAAEVGGQWGIDDCPACNGLGEQWPAALVEAIGKVLYTEEWERDVLDAVESWMEAGE